MSSYMAIARLLPILSQSEIDERAPLVPALALSSVWADSLLTATFSNIGLDRPLG